MAAERKARSAGTFRRRLLSLDAVEQAKLAMAVVELQR